MKERLLIIDDDPIFCYILDKLIKKQGAYATATFNSALDGLDHLDKMTGAQEVLIFLDINMPEMNGWQFLEALNNVRYNFTIQVAIVTSSIDPEDQKRSSTYDMVTTVFTKPVAANELQDMLQSRELSNSSN